MATELSDWFLSQLGSQLIFLCVVKFKMATRFAEPTKVEIVALFEKATPENTKKATEYGVKILNSKFKKMKKNFK